MAEENEEELQLPDVPSMDDPKVRALMKIFFGIDIEQLSPEMALSLKEEFTKKIQDIMKVILAFIPITGQTLTDDFVDNIPSLNIPQPPDPSELMEKFENKLPEIEEPEPVASVTNPFKGETYEKSPPAGQYTVEDAEFNRIVDAIDTYNSENS